MIVAVHRDGRGDRRESSRSAAAQATTDRSETTEQRDPWAAVRASPRPIGMSARLAAKSEPASECASHAGALILPSRFHCRGPRRFGCPERQRDRTAFGRPPTNAARCSPVSVDFAATRSAGVPSNTIRPPSWPAPGPRSMIQSACAITAWWCSITMTDFPESTIRSSSPSSCWRSARCNPVVSSSST